MGAPIHFRVACVRRRAHAVEKIECVRRGMHNNIDDPGRDLPRGWRHGLLPVPVPATSGEQVHEHFTSVRDHRHFTGFSNVVWGLASVRCFYIRRSPLSYGTLLQTTLDFIRHWGDILNLNIASLNMVTLIGKF